MAQTATPEQVASVQSMLASVEVAYQATLRARRAIETLAKLGQLKCRDVQNYNLQASAVWAYQSTAARLMIAAGGQAPPIPDPVYVAWKGVPGDQAADIDCNASGMAGVSGAWRRAVNWFAASKPIRGADIEWRTGASVADQKLVAAAVAKAAKRAGAPPRSASTAAAGAPLSGAGLGVPAFLVYAGYVVLVGLTVGIVAWAVTSILDAFHDVEGKQIAYNTVAVQATQNTEIMEKRTACYNDCSGRGRDPALCATSCATAYPAFKPVLPAGTLGVLGTVAGVAVIGVVGYGAYRLVKSRDWGGGSSASRLPQSHHLDAGAIDVEAA